MHFTTLYAITMVVFFAFISPLFLTVKEFHQSAQPIGLPTDNRTAAPRKAQTERPTQRPAWGTWGADQSEENPPPLPPPPRRTDPLAADRAAPDAHGRPATPTARVCPRGARRRQRMTGVGATGHAKGQGGGKQQSGPASPPPTLPPRPASRRSAGPPPPRSRGDVPPPPEGTATPGPARRAPRCPPPPAPAGVAADGRARTSAPEQRTDHARGRHATKNRNSMGAAPPMTRASPVTPTMLPTRGGRREGLGLSEPPGERLAGRSSPPPPSARQAASSARGGPATPTERARRGGVCAGDERGAG